MSNYKILVHAKRTLVDLFFFIYFEIVLLKISKTISVSRKCYTVESMGSRILCKWFIREIRKVKIMWIFKTPSGIKNIKTFNSWIEKANYLKFIHSMTPHILHLLSNYKPYKPMTSTLFMFVWVSRSWFSISFKLESYW